MPPRAYINSPISMQREVKASQGIKPLTLIKAGTNYIKGSRPEVRKMRPSKELGGRGGLHGDERGNFDRPQTRGPLHIPKTSRRLHTAPDKWPVHLYRFHIRRGGLVHIPKR